MRQGTGAPTPDRKTYEMSMSAQEIKLRLDTDAAEKRQLIKFLAGGAVALATGVHGWLALQYGTPEPCAAAVERLVAVGGTELLEQAERKLAGNPFGGLAIALMPGMLNSMKPIYLQTMRKKGPLTCYLAAFGTMDDELIGHLRASEAQQ
jgi:hypothetical protein